jgi:hypothetical protein
MLEFFTLEMRTDGMQAHLNDCRKRVRRLRAMDVLLTDKMVLAVVLNSLPDIYKPMIHTLVGSLRH